MLAYPIDEAEELLKGKLASAKTSLEHCEEDMDFLREQITVRFFVALACHVVVVFVVVVVLLYGALHS